MAFLGMRGTGDWSDSDFRPKDWNEAVLFLFPNGTAPLTAILSKLPSKKTTDPEFYWYDEELPLNIASVTGVYTDSGLGTAYTSGGVSGDVLYFKMSASDVSNFRKRHVVQALDADDYTMTVVGKVVDTLSNGASSYVAVQLMEDDDNSSSHDLSDCDKLCIIGDANPEGADMPASVQYEPTKYYNYTQIWRTPLEYTKTQLATKTRTGDQYLHDKKMTLKQHSIKMERSFLWGLKSETVGSNGKKERTTQGIVRSITSNVYDFKTDNNALWNGDAWLTSGHLWLNYVLGLIFQYGETEKLALCGYEVLTHINNLAEKLGTNNISPRQTDYGIKVTTWVTPHGEIHMKTHPLFSTHPVYKNVMLLIEPGMLKRRPLRDTKYYKDRTEQSGGHTRIDAIAEEFLTEAGLEMHHEKTFGFLTGFGETNTN